MTDIWTEDGIAEAMRLKNVEGLTFAAIAERFNVTRNVIAGVIFREVNRDDIRVNIWTTERVEKLRQMYEDQRSYFVISQAIGVSESSVRRKARILGLPSRTQDSSVRFRWIGGKPSRNVRTPPRAFAVVLAPDTTPVPLMERTGCCYPTTEHSPHLFCNAEVSKSSYCDFHQRVMYGRPE